MTKINGVRVRGVSKKIGTPYLFLQPLKLTTSNLIYNLSLGSSLSKTTFSVKIDRGLARGASTKYWIPLFICVYPVQSNDQLRQSGVKP